MAHAKWLIAVPLLLVGCSSPTSPAPSLDDAMESYDWRRDEQGFWNRYPFLVAEYDSLVVQYKQEVTTNE